MSDERQPDGWTVVCSDGTVPAHAQPSALDPPVDRLSHNYGTMRDRVVQFDREHPACGPHRVEPVYVGAPPKSKHYVHLEHEVERVERAFAETRRDKPRGES